MSDEQNPYKAPQADLKQQSVPQGSEGGFTSAMALSLKQTRPWVRFLSILGFVWLGFMVVASVAMMFGSGPAGYGALIGIVYIVLAVLYAAPVLFLHRYASSITRFLESGTSEEMEHALGYQKSFWKFSGILALITILVAIIGTVIGLGSMAAGFMG